MHLSVRSVPGLWLNSFDCGALPEYQNLIETEDVEGWESRCHPSLSDAKSNAKKHRLPYSLYQDFRRLSLISHARTARNQRLEGTTPVHGARCPGLNSSLSSFPSSVPPPSSLLAMQSGGGAGAARGRSAR
eukprot:3166687-Rhodomonas_salina.1